jgi:predicted permease
MRLPRKRPPEAARRAARLRFGNVAKAKEDTRRIWGVVQVEQLWQDLLFGMRRMRRSPGHTCVAVLTLALGIGAVTTVFSVVNALLFRPLPVLEPDRLVTISRLGDRAGLLTPVSYPEFLGYRALADVSGAGVFTEVMAYADTQVDLTTSNGAERVWVAAVSGNYFSGLGVAATLGRTFLHEDDRPYGDSGLLVLTETFWQRRLGGDPGVVGRVVGVNGHPYTIVGVTAKGFRGVSSQLRPAAFALLTSFDQLRPEWPGQLGERSRSVIGVLGRLAPEVSAADAEMALSVAATEQTSVPPGTLARGTVRVLSERRSRPGVRSASIVPRMATVFLGLAALLLLVASANVASLTIANGLARTPETSLRVALGAGWGRLARQLLSESLLLAAMGGVLGVVLSVWATRILELVGAVGTTPKVYDFRVDWRVLAVSAAAVTVAGVIAGLTTAIRVARGGLARNPPLGSGSIAVGRWRWTGRGAVVMLQIAVSTCLLSGAGLFVLSLYRAARFDFGFRVDNVLLLSVDPLRQGYDEARGRAFYRESAKAVSRLPGVTSASWAGYSQFSPEHPVPMTDVVAESVRTTSPVSGEPVWINRVGPAYLRTMGIAVLRGRGFQDADRARARPVAVISEMAAHRLFPGEDPIGRLVRFRAGDDYAEPREVIGIAQDAHYSMPGLEAGPSAYIPLEQAYRGSGTLHIHTDGAPGKASAAARDAIVRIDGSLPVYNVVTMHEVLDAGPLHPFWLAATLAGSFGFVALTLAAVGIFGLVSYSVGRRRHEFGIRRALGAPASEIVLLATRDVAWLTLAGTGVGLVLSFALMPLAAGLLVNVTPTEPVVLVAVSVILCLVSLAACLIPACRATRAEPMAALRTD